jgi:tetratricopeptide (TPR) repeat protein
MLGRNADAAAMARRSMLVPIRADLVGNGSRQEFENRLGLALVFAGKADEAVRLLERVAADGQQAGRAQGEVQGRTLHFLAGALAARGDWARALETGRQAQSLIEQGATGRDIRVARSQLGQAVAAAHLGQAAQAQALIGEAESHLQKIVAADHPGHLLLQVMRAETLRAGGQLAEAERIDTLARDALRARHGVVLPRFMPLLF